MKHNFVIVEAPILPKRFLNVKFDKKTDPELKEMGTKFVKNFDIYYEAGFAPTFLGPSGLGKSYAAAAIVNELANKVPIIWADAVDSLNNIIELYDFKDKGFFTRKKKLISIPLLVLDDFTQLRQFARIRELFFHIVNARYANKLPTIFTGNIEENGVEAFNTITKEFSPEISRRIQSMSNTLLVTREKSK